MDTTGQARKLEQLEKAGKNKLNTHAESLDRGPGYSVNMGVGFTPAGGLGGWAPGITPRYLPDGYGYVLPKGSDVVLQVHYHRNGRLEKDRTKQQALLEQTLDELDEGAATLDEMVAAWRAGELEALSAELFEEFADYPGLYEKLVTKRNSAWVPAFEGMLDDGGRHLVVVGALHLVGPGNVIELLKKRGHDVERLH